MTIRIPPVHIGCRRVPLRARCAGPMRASDTDNDPRAMETHRSGLNQRRPLARVRIGPLVYRSRRIDLWGDGRFDFVAFRRSRPEIFRPLQPGLQMGLYLQPSQSQEEHMSDNLTSAHINQIQSHLDSLLPGDSSTSNPPPTPAPSRAQTDFCAIWPEAEPLLKLVVSFIAFIPGAGATAATLIKGLIAAGDSVRDQICH
jgi:hypothetical protein